VYRWSTYFEDEHVATRQLTIVDAQPDLFTFCCWGDVNIHVWWGPVVEDVVQRLGSFSSATMRAHPGGMSFVHIVTSSARLPDAEARGALVALSKRFEHDTGPTAVVIGGEGFFAGALRAAVTGLWLAAPKTMPMRMCGNAEEVAAWLPARHLESTGVQLDAAELNNVVREAGRRECSHSARRSIRAPAP
jgi:hypothetical protein